MNFTPKKGLCNVFSTHHLFNWTPNMISFIYDKFFPLSLCALFFVIVCNIFFLQKFKFQIIYVQINAFLLILLSTLHFCELICRFFGCSIMINKKTIYPIVEMDDLDFIIGDIAFVENSQLHQHFIL
jgi:hypothetical protein